MASKSLIWHTFGSLTAALREAGFDVPVGDEKLERAVEHGAVLARELGRLPKMADWKEARTAQTRRCMSEWQVYRLVDIDAGPWAAFQFLVRERLREEGVTVGPDGSLVGRRRHAASDARGRAAPTQRASRASRGTRRLRVALATGSTVVRFRNERSGRKRFSVRTAPSTIRSSRPSEPRACGA